MPNSQAESIPHKPKIAITTDLTYDVTPYLVAVEQAGGDPLVVTAASGVDMQQFDGLLLCGGVDVDPSLYNEPMGPKTETPDPDRDRFEIGMLQDALEADQPVLAICRGMQLCNVLHGGTLAQHIEGHEFEPGTSKAEPSHSVEIAKGSKLAEIVGADRTDVNSRHHQAVGTLGERLVVSARAADNTVEALERPDRRFVVAVQWHPENMVAENTSDAQKKLFARFIAAAAVVAH